MAFVVQNDTGTETGANSYNEVQEFIDYWADRDVDYSTTPVEEIEALLISSTSYTDNRYKYAGYKLNGRDQTTEFPRGELYDCSGETPVLVEGVPREIKEAVNEYAHIQKEQGSLQANGSIDGNIKRKKEKVGPIEEETEYQPPGQSGALVAYPQADNKIPDCFKSPLSVGGMAVHT
jgi:hypothetical protein